MPSAPGGALDIVSRVVAERLTAGLGQQVIVDNRPGAEQTIALELVAKASADGYTLVAVGDSITVLPSLYRKLSFDPQTSFAPVILMITQPNVLAVHAAVPAANFKEFVALAKAKPGALSLASGSAAHHLTGELIKKLSGITMIHVPYKGGAPVVVDLIGGQGPRRSARAVRGFAADPHRQAAHSGGDHRRALGCVTEHPHTRRIRFERIRRLSMEQPARARQTPREIIAQLNGEMTKILTQPAVRERLEAAGFEPRAGSPQEVEVLIRDGQAHWGKLIRELSLKLD